MEILHHLRSRPVVTVLDSSLLVFFFVSAYPGNFLLFFLSAAIGRKAKSGKKKKTAGNDVNRESRDRSGYEPMADESR